MTTGVILREIDSNLLGIDDEGNLILNTKGKMAGQVASGNAPAFMVVGGPSQIVISNAAGTSNISNVTFQVADASGAAVSGNFVFDILLSDASTGLGLTGTTASGGIAAAGSGGTVLQVITAAKNLKVQTASGGKFVLAITDTAKTGFYPVAYYNGRVFVGAQLTSSSYG